MVMCEILTKLVEMTRNYTILKHERLMGDHFLLLEWTEIFTELFINQASLNERVCYVKFYKKKFAL